MPTELCSLRALRHECITNPDSAQFVTSSATGIRVGGAVRHRCRPGSPLKQACGTKGGTSERCNRIAARPRDTIFSDTYRRTGAAECDWGASNAECPAEESQEAEACGDHPHRRSAGEAYSEAPRCKPPRFGRNRRDRAQARRSGSRNRRSAKIPRTAARGDRHPAAGHRVPRRRRSLHPLEQEIRRDLQSQLGPVRAGRAAAGHHPHRRRARRLSRSDRPRRGVDRRADR